MLPFLKVFQGDCKLKINGRGEGKPPGESDITSPEKKKKKGKDIQLFLHRIQQVGPALLGEGL